MQIKPLEWVEIDEDYFEASSPASHNNRLVFTYEQGKYWAMWDLLLPGYESIDQVKAEGQKHHDQYVKDFIARYTC